MAGLLDFGAQPSGGGLLDFIANDPGSRLGLTMLAASSPKYGRGIAEALQANDQFMQRKQESEWQKMQRDRQAKEWTRQDQENALAAQFFTPGTRELPPLAGDQSAGILPSQGRPAKPAGFDMEGYAQAMMQVNPAKGMQLLQSMQKELPVDKINPEKFTPQSLAKFAQTRNFGDLVPRDKLEFIEGVGVNPHDLTNANRAIPNPNKPFQMNSQGQIVPNQAYQDYEIRKASAGASRTSNNLINAGPKAFDVELAKLDANQLDAWRKTAETSQGILGTVQGLRQADAQGAYSGGGSQAKLAASSLINGLTGYTPKGFVGSELYNSEAKKLILDKVKTLGANPSNADREFIEQTVPQLNTSKEARAKMADFMERKAKESISIYQRAEAHARKNSSLAGFDQFPQPQAQSGNIVDFGSLK